MKTRVLCNRIKLRPGSLERVREWAETLNERRDEALATLRDEGVTIESAFLERATDGDFLIIYMRASDLDSAVGAAAHSAHPIDAYHQEFKREAWQGGEALELLVDLVLDRDD